MSSLVIVCSFSILVAASGAKPNPDEEKAETGNSEGEIVQNIFYGGILKEFRDVQANDTDIQSAAAYALDYVSIKHGDKLARNSKDEVIRPEVLNPRKLKLQYTMDGATPFHYDVISIEGGKKQQQSRQVILGLMYYFTLAWPSIPNTYQHRFVLTQDRMRNSYIYEHTLYFPDKLPKLELADHCKEIDTSQVTSTSQSVTAGDVVASSQSGAGAYSPVAQTDQLECRTQRDDLWSLPPDVRNKELSSKFEVKSRRRDSNTQEYLVNIGSYNIWNFNSFTEGSEKGYIRRIMQLGEILAQSDADIVGLQEVRFTLEKGGKLGPSQVHHLSLALPSYQFVYQPAMTYLENIFGRVEEGLAVFSRFPIISHDFILLHRNASDPDDFHQRICLHAEVEIPVFGKLHVFVTHLSLSEKARDRSVVEIWEFMSQFSGPAILVGDLNADSQSRAIKFLSGNTEINGIKTKGLYDAWTLRHPEPRPDQPGVYSGNDPRDHGLTFSTLNKHLKERIDYIFVRLPEDCRLHNISLLDDGKRRQSAASDHLGLLATISMVMNLT
ncbi:uncharacterized protein LOC144446195 [Glandiceps talaboti]